MERGYIYKITCLLTGKLYIGQTLRTIEKRWKRHIRDSKKGSDHKFHRAIRKYGEENFLVEELLAVSAPTKKELKSQLDSLEIEYISRFNTREKGYNSTDGGEGVVGRVCSEESRERYRQANLGERNPSFGKACSESTKEKVRKARLGKTSPMKGKKHSDSAKRKMSEAHSGERNPNFGKVASKETRRKLSEAHVGKKLSEEQKKKISDSVKRMWNKKSLNNLVYGQES